MTAICMIFYSCNRIEFQKVHVNNTKRLKINQVFGGSSPCLYAKTSDPLGIAHRWQRDVVKCAASARVRSMKFQQSSHAPCKTLILSFRDTKEIIFALGVVSVLHSAKCSVFTSDMRTRGATDVGYAGGGSKQLAAGPELKSHRIKPLYRRPNDEFIL